MHHLRAIVIMILSMVLLALSDMFIKLAAQRLPVGQVMLGLSLGGTLALAVLARLRGSPVFSRLALHRLVLLRNLLEVVAAFGLVLALAFAPISTVAAIMQAAPLIVTLGAALILREPVGWRRWGAIMAGFAGMLLVVRPGPEGFEPAALLAVMGVTALALRDLVTRVVPAGISTLSLTVWGFAATIPAGAVVLLAMGTPPSADPVGLVHVAGAVVVTASGYFAVTTAMRMAPVAIVSPFRYSRLVFTMSLGILVFGERPDGQTLLGAAIIIASGLYAYLRERQLANAAARAGRGQAS